MYQKYSRLINKEHKLTFARKKILDALIISTTHQTADEIYQYLRVMSKELGIATVYRTLDLFEKLNIVEVLIKDQTKYYKIVNPNQKNHIHFICSDCQDIVEFDDPVLLDLDQKIREYMSDTYKHQITEHLSVTGICKKCLIKKETEI